MAMGTSTKRERQEGCGTAANCRKRRAIPKRLNEVLWRQAASTVSAKRAAAAFYHQSWAAVASSEAVFPADDDRIFRGPGQRARHRLAGGRFAHAAAVSPDRTGRENTGSRDHFAHRRLDEATHQEVFGWVLNRLARVGLLKVKTIGIDSTTLEANAAMKSIVRRDTQESYTEYLQRLAQAEGVKAEGTAALRRMGPEACQENVE